MTRSAIPFLIVAFAVLAGLGLHALSLAAGSKEQAATVPTASAKEEPLSVIASAAPIDQRQPQHIKTATFALG
jgi:hypothetical protein